MRSFRRKTLRRHSIYPWAVNRQSADRFAWPIVTWWWWRSTYAEKYQCLDRPCVTSRLPPLTVLRTAGVERFATSFGLTRTNGTGRGGPLSLPDTCGAVGSDGNRNWATLEYALRPIEARRPVALKSVPSGLPESALASGPGTPSGPSSPAGCADHSGQFHWETRGDPSWAACLQGNHS
jgi:hypothetical protein